ncbi:UDP-Glycosyltransferase superfamily protein isoform X2 [Tasmannia lanceolata]|uniref:UDP-Glycosyltransferase superfamily protein isoform X2 n=1 Tax=Tasmannia lanceolata TaxID=3420 RepID=UPI004063CB53
MSGFFKRNPNPNPNRNHGRDWRSDRRSRPRPRRNFTCPTKGSSQFYCAIFALVVISLVATIFLQSSVTNVFKPGGEKVMFSRDHHNFGNVLRFVPLRLLQRFSKQSSLDLLRTEPRVAIRPPRLAIVLGSMKKDPLSLMLLTVAKGLQRLGYMLTIYTIEDGEAHSSWKQIGCQPFVLGGENISHVDWSIFEGIVLSSLEAERATTSLMQEPFSSIPVIWVIQEDALGKRLPVYAEMGWDPLIIKWRSAFSRADVVVFPEFSLPMLYSVLDNGNFYVISGSPVDVWAAESYIESHSKYQLRKENELREDDLLILVIGSPLFYNELPWEYATAMHAIGPLAMKLMRTKDMEGSFKFVFLCGNSTDGYRDTLQIVNRVHGLIFRARDPDTLTRAFSLLLSDMKLSKFAHLVASSGKLLSRDMLASECITGYARLLEDVLQFPSDTLLPVSISQLQQRTWEWTLFNEEMEMLDREVTLNNFDQSSVVYALENELASNDGMRSASENETETMTHDNPTQLDWDVLSEMEISEDFERRETEQLVERMDRTFGSWEETYNIARKAEKLKFEANERDEGELERTGQPLCIYEIYSGNGAWPFLHHGALYRGLSLSTRARRSKSDDVDAVSRLPLLNDTYYRDLLCEIGGMFSIANRVDGIHKIPWIGFQSWRAAGRQVSLSIQAENILEETIHGETKGDVIYYWVRLDIDTRLTGAHANLNFWSMCDILNGGHCRAVFENTFRQMYGLPLDMATLPPMPDDGDHWSSLHCWAMPTPSFLEFMMFSRMFVDSLDNVVHNWSNGNACFLGSSKLEKKHCYCRILDLLVNVWAYHSARKMVYINPNSGSLEEQHPIEQRNGLMWVKYFNFTLLKSMDEDLAEEADDQDHPNDRWLWPLTGEVHWQGIYEREREERYRQKMDKKRKSKQKLSERHRKGYQQKTLGR